MLIKVLLLFFYCFSSKRILLLSYSLTLLLSYSLAPFSLEQAIKINFKNKRKHSDSVNEERKENKDFDFKKKSKKSDKKSIQSQKDPKKYQCDECDKKFTRIKNLIIHKRTHTGEQPCQCDVCLKRFTQNSNLKQHKTTQHNKKHDVPQMEDISDSDLNNIEKCFD